MLSDRRSSCQMRLSPDGLMAAARLLVLVVESCKMHREPIDGRLELRVVIDELAQLCGQPGHADLVVAAALLELFDPSIGEVHGHSVRESRGHELALLALVGVSRTGGRGRARRAGDPRQ